MSLKLFEFVWNHVWHQLKVITVKKGWEPLTYSFIMITEHSGEHGHLEEDDHQVRRRLQSGEAASHLQGVGRQNCRRILYTGNSCFYCCNCCICCCRPELIPVYSQFRAKSFLFFYWPKMRKFFLSCRQYFFWLSGRGFLGSYMV